MVEVRQSRLDQAGEGLFAKTDLPSRTIVALFAGVRLKTATVAARLSCNKYYLCQMSLHMLHIRERPRSDYRIGLNVDLDLDIPDTCVDTSAYCATLGHKANHSFTPNGSFDLFEHPRFGLIRAILSLEDIK